MDGSIEIFEKWRGKAQIGSGEKTFSRSITLPIPIIFARIIKGDQMRILLAIAYDVLYILSALIIVQVILDNLSRVKEFPLAEKALRFIRPITNPVLAPFRLICPVRLTQGWDLSPFLAMLVLYFLRNLLNQMR